MVLTPSKFSVFTHAESEVAIDHRDVEYDVCVVEPTEYARVFVGKCPEEPAAFDSREAYAEFSDGNSVLIHLGSDRYMFVGAEIRTFEAVDPIVGYMSPIGNNDVPYPYAVGSTHTYLIPVGKRISNDAVADDDDPYARYYGDKNSQYVSDFEWSRKE